MNKIYVVSLLVVTSVLFVYAQQGGVTNEMRRGAPLQVSGQTQQGQVRMMPRTTPPVQVKEGVGSKSVVPPQVGQNGLGGDLPKPPLPSTGDPVVDAQIKALTVEMETKVKAITEDYRTKVQALLLTKGIKAFPMMVSGTPVQRMMQPRDTGSEGASSTQERMMRDVQAKIQGEVDRQNKIDNPTPAPRMPIFQQMGSLFQGMFGRGN